MSTAESHTEQAYRQCESITRAAAGNFYYGIRLLPAPKRRAMCAIYAWARRVDDIGDGTLPAAEKLRRLQEVERALSNMRADDPDPVVAALADAAARFALPADAMSDLVEGVRMDVRGTAYADFGELELYCRRVAGSIGRLCLAIFGARPAPPGGGAGRVATTEPVGWAPDKTGRPASELADDLGVALQLANIVRDLREDAERGRVYLPAKDLVRYHLHDDAPLDAPALQALMREASYAERAMVEGFEGGDVGQLYALIRFHCLHARDFFHRGMELVGRLDRRSAACVLAMAGIYWRLLRRIEERPDRALARRTRLGKREKAWVAVRALLGKGIPERHPAERLQDDA
ncbi:MAG TPA: squalene/phytoene synthase family protein [Solirubrobacteraceae bacterium]|nr:squalene/phytoene synthase family protein [Solirubrobacteraceae bacterium]